MVSKRCAVGGEAATVTLTGLGSWGGVSVVVGEEGRICVLGWTLYLFGFFCCTKKSVDCRSSVEVRYVFGFEKFPD
jgi:hypothetical protein